MDLIYGILVIVVIQEVVAQFPRPPLTPTGSGIGRPRSVFLGPDPTQMALPGGARGFSAPRPVPGQTRCPGDRRIPGIQCGQVSGRMDCPTGAQCMTDSTDRYSYCCWDQESPVESPCDDPLVENGVFRTCNLGEGDGTGCPAPCHACRPLSSTGMGACCPQITRPGCERSSPARNEFLRQRQLIQGGSTAPGSTSSSGSITPMESSVSAAGAPVGTGSPRGTGSPVGTGATVGTGVPGSTGTTGGSVPVGDPRAGAPVVETGGAPVIGTVQGTAPRPGSGPQSSGSLGSMTSGQAPPGARLTVDALPSRPPPGGFTGTQPIPPEVDTLPGNILPPPRRGAMPAGSRRTISPGGGVIGGSSVCGPGVRPAGTCSPAGLCGMGYQCVGVTSRYGVCCPLSTAGGPGMTAGGTIPRMTSRAIPGMTSRARGGAMFTPGFSSGMISGFGRRECPPPMFQRCIRIGRPQCYMDAQCPRPMRCCSPSPRCLARCL